MTISSRIRIALLSLAAAAGVLFGAGWLGYTASAGPPPYVVHAEEPAFSRVAEGPVQIAQADTDSAAGLPATEPTADAPATTAPAPDVGSAAEPAPIGSPLDELAAMKAKYEALKAAKGSGSKDLLWFAYAALAAAAIRVLLAGIHTWRGDKPKGWAKWAALGLAVPLALLTYYAAGAGLWPAIVMAGAGPGAIIVNELLKRKAAPAS